MAADDDGSPDRGPADTPADTPADGTPLPRVLCDTAELLSLGDDTAAGALWRLAEPGRQLDANVVRVPAGGRVGTHTEPDLDVLLIVLDGTADLVRADGERPLRAGALTWLPHGSARGIAAGPDGVTYLTVHRRRPGMRIQPPDAAGRATGPGGV
ncbi:cupin domain-containing protein [Streptomyces sp. NPDC057381]|uniref:cupin domain-containing protein n=1 Tax=Streptomyces sp. NPDC057381 TaxID=3346111 RepID=UPI003645BF2A